MPLQNRVTPFGEIVAVAQRGMFTGNRGIIHEPETKTLLSRRWSSKAWLTCTCDYKGRRREVMAGRSWTELFFYDEPTALAAGHRPCFFCRRDAANAFRSAWARGNGVPLPDRETIDGALHRERLDGRQKRIHPLPMPLSALPEGTMLAAGGAALLVMGSGLQLWTEDGYRELAESPAIDGMLTPPSTLRTLTAGYRPMLHPGLSTGD